MGPFWREAATPSIGRESGWERYLGGVRTYCGRCGKHHKELPGLGGFCREARRGIRWKASLRDAPDYFFPLDFNLVGMPTPMAWSCSRPCLHCAPYVPLGSTSMHFW